MSEEFIQKRLAELSENGIETISSLRADKAALTARVAQLEADLRWIDAQRYTDRQTIHHDNAYQMAGQLNEKLLAIMDRARAALTQPTKGGE